MDTAMQELRTAVTIDLQDHVRFTPAPHHRLGPARNAQPDRVTATLKITPHVGVRAMHAFSVDVVVGTLITAGPDLHQVAPVADVPGLIRPPYRLYSVVDHIADKVCATVEHQEGRPSSRHRDLVDLVVLACTQPVDAGPLGRAIEAERLHRGLPPITTWASPPQWAGAYATTARAVRVCADHPTYTAATALINEFLDPVLTGQMLTGTWNPQARHW